MGNKFLPIPAAASYISRVRLGQDFLRTIAPAFTQLLLLDASKKYTYAELKKKVGMARQGVKKTVKQALGGWVKNDGDECFTLYE